MCRRKNIPILFAIVALLALTVCGSLWDYEIANALYVGQLPADNFFGILFSFIGIFPTFVGWNFLGTGILRLSKKQTENQTKRRDSAIFKKTRVF